MSEDTAVRQLTANVEALTALMADSEKRHRRTMRYVNGIMLGMAVMMGAVTFERAEIISPANATILKNLGEDEKLVRDILTKINTLLDSGTIEKALGADQEGMLAILQKINILLDDAYQGIQVIKNNGPAILRVSREAADLVERIDDLMIDENQIGAALRQELAVMNRTMIIMGDSMGSTMGRMGQWMPPMP